MNDWEKTTLGEIAKGKNGLVDGPFGSRFSYMIYRRECLALKNPYSVQDFVCMRIADERGWGCATNDKALRRECGKRGVSVLWGLEMMLYLVKMEL